MASTNNFPTLDELLSEKTIFILGAGASKDYGFPLWEEMKKDYLSYLSSPSSENNIFYNHPGKDYWLETLSKESDKTIDQLAILKGDDELHLFQALTYNYFLELEANDKKTNKSGWIEKIAEKYSNGIEDRKTNRNLLTQWLSNLQVCSMNYERCFPYRFGNIIRESLSSIFNLSIMVEHTLQGIDRKYRHYYQPHGSLGNLHPGDTAEMTINYSHHLSKGMSRAVAYGDSSQIISSVQKVRNFIMPAGLLSWGNENQCYQALQNTVLRDAKNIIVVGVSELGWADSEFPKRFETRTASFYCTGKTAIDERFQPLGIWAEEMAELL